jgi:hypothetical protein
MEHGSKSTDQFVTYLLAHLLIFLF